MLLLTKEEEEEEEEVLGLQPNPVTTNLNVGDSFNDFV